MILAGDIGGTNARLALADPASGRVSRLETYRVAEFADLLAALHRFLDDVGYVPRTGRFDAACFAVAGPIVGRAAKLTNAPWTVDADVIERELGIPDVRLANDFAAAAAGVDALAPMQLATLQQGDPQPHAPRLVIGPGTGLGVAVAVWSGGRYRVIPGEGGHVGFAPVDDEQMRLWRFLHGRIGRVRAEDVVSGPGLVNLYAFTAGGAGDRVRLPEDVEREGAAAVAERAFVRKEPAALNAIALFTACFGSIAGDHALTVLPRGGVYIAGGIAPRMLDALKKGFPPRFNAKGSHEPLMRATPVHVVLEDKLGLLGAALLAARRLD